jgi:hypothetical protein
MQAVSVCNTCGCLHYYQGVLPADCESCTDAKLRVMMQRRGGSMYGEPPNRSLRGLGVIISTPTRHAEVPDIWQVWTRTIEYVAITPPTGTVAGSDFSDFFSSRLGKLWECAGAKQPRKKKQYGPEKHGAWWDRR